MDNLNLLSLGGRLVLIGLMGGAVTEINLALLMGKRARVVGSTLARGRSTGGCHGPTSQSDWRHRKCD